MVKKVRQVLERKTETVTSTFATRMLSIDQCVIQILHDIIIREQQLHPVWYCYTHAKNGVNSKLYEKLSILFL
jgi:hypothetical protein